jgi:hypothetical protein
MWTSEFRARLSKRSRERLCRGTARTSAADEFDERVMRQSRGWMIPPAEEF